MQNNCIYYTKLAYVDHFMSAAKGVDAEDKVMELLNDIENQVYTKVSNEVNGKLIKELQKVVNLAQPTPTTEFLRITPELDSTYMHSHQNFSSRIGENQPLNREQFEQVENKRVVDFPIYHQNFLDTNANAKHYYPQPSSRGLHQTQKQYNDQTNVQHYLIESNEVFDFEQPQIKQIFPRKLIDTTVPIYPEPDYINQQEKSFNFRNQVNKMGGLMNTIQPMQQYMQQNEQRLFLNTPEHSLLAGAVQEKQVYVPPSFIPVPVPPPPDPFNTNPQYRLYGVQQQNPPFNVQSYVPQKQPEIYKQPSQLFQIPESEIISSSQRISKVNSDQPQLSFLQQARNERQKREQKLQQ